MSQFNVIPQSGPKSGAQMADAMQKAVDATNSAHFGATEPDYKTQGMIWVKNVSSTINEIYIYDGAQWILLGYFNPTAHTLTAMSLADGQVTMAKLQQISTSRLLGRKTAGSGAIEILTPTEVTAMLDAFTGDSGSGGVKGMVPAPSAGDAAAAKFLKANGAWAAPPSGVEPGTIGFFAMDTAPTGWLEAYGQAVSRSTYAALYAKLGDVHGAGNGSTTFNLPDYRGMVLAGMDDMGGVSRNKLTGLSGGVDGDAFGAQGGTESTTLVLGNLPPINVPIQMASGSGSASTLPGRGFTPNAGGTYNVAAGGSRDPFNNVQPTAIVLICVKT